MPFMYVIVNDTGQYGQNAEQNKIYCNFGFQFSLIHNMMLSLIKIITTLLSDYGTVPYHNLHSVQF